MLFLGFEAYSDAARFMDPTSHKVVVSRDYVVPSVTVASEDLQIHKDPKSLPAEVSASDTHVTLKTSSIVVLPSFPSKKASKANKVASQGSSVQIRSPPYIEEIDDESESEVSLETEALRVLGRNSEERDRMRAEIRREQARLSGTVALETDRVQGRHYSIPSADLARLRPTWEWAPDDYRPPNEIRGGVDESNILSSRRRPQPTMPGGLDEQPDIVNLVQPVTMTEALGSVLEKPLWLEAMTNEHASQLAHLTGDLVLAPKDEKVIGGMWVLSRKLNKANEVIRHKAHWVGFGNHQEPMKHLYETYASVAALAILEVSAPWDK
ncbi:hypothetical protein PCANC_26055 [Puccinia coronata f. sp. avenae]|uniref:Reverse transcriptase Ty1/copia-type domain-containing protein n=1 Tax=Puccinia coronata f. sp. avenae TaxID=200324 RepID=A0A2N5TVG0_9BASI|nr:hypothetical protein PCANC_26055 [Puccinia coronata f. sp. avenae]